MNRKSTPGGIKILVDARLLTDTIDHLNDCAGQLIRLIECAVPERASSLYTYCLAGACKQLEGATEDLFNGVSEGIGLEEKARKRRQRT